MTVANCSFPTVESQTVGATIPNVIRLSMVPANGSAVTISDYTQVSANPGVNQFTVDYSSGDLTFVPSVNGTVLSVSYTPTLDPGFNSERITFDFTVSSGKTVPFSVLAQKPPKVIYNAYFITAGAMYSQAARVISVDDVAAYIAGSISTPFLYIYGGGVNVQVPDSGLADGDWTIVALVGY